VDWVNTQPGVLFFSEAGLFSFFGEYSNVDEVGFQNNYPVVPLTEACAKGALYEPDKR
jgi:hypothetical protein